MIGLWITLGVLGFLTLAVLVTAYVCYRRMLYSPPRHMPGEGEYQIPDGVIYRVFREDMIAWTKMIRAYPYKDYSITSHDGLTLRAKFFELTPGAPIELMFHGYRGNAERDLNGGVERCFQVGHSALLIDHRGAGYSDGTLITFGILEKRDCLAWIDFALKEFGEDARLILTGISMGAATVMMTAGQPLPPQVQYVLADCGYTSPKDIICKVANDLHYPVRIAYPFLKLGARIYGHFRLEEMTAEKAVKNAKIPILIIHGDDDRFVPMKMSRVVAEANPQHVSYQTFAGAGHGLSYIVDYGRYSALIRSFMKQVLD